jgi:ribonuclease HIII
MTAKQRVIGVDEAGKGDFFGPLVVASFLASNDEIDRLKLLGVRDSKLIATKKLLTIDEQLRAEFPHSILVLAPPEYNQQHRQCKNLNKMLAEQHAAAIDGLNGEARADLAISDKFGKAELIEDALAARDCPIPLQQLVRGESIAQVAAASILARAEFVRQIDRLSEELGTTVPRGAGAIVDEAGRKLVSQHGIEILEKIAKVHFKNFARASNLSLLV